MGSVEYPYAYNIGGSKVFADSYTATTVNGTTTFTLVNNNGSTPTATTIDSSNVSSTVGKYTCNSTSTTCSNAGLYKINSITEGTKALTSKSTTRDNIGSRYYTTYLLNLAGYMYNTELRASSSQINSIYSFLDSEYPLVGKSTILSWYFSDSFLSGTSAYSSCGSSSNTEGNNTCYTLSGTPQKGSALVGSDNDYSKLVGKFTLKNTSSTYGSTSKVSSLYYVIGYNENRLYLQRIMFKHPLAYYQKTLNLSQSYENGALQNSIQVKNFVTPDELQSNPLSWQNTWVFVYGVNNYFRNYYMCTDGSDTCTPLYITDADYNSVHYFDVGNTYNFSNTYTYNSSTNKYTLDMTDPNAAQVFDIRNMGNGSLLKAHYVCLDDTENLHPVANQTECTNIGYIYGNDISYGSSSTGRSGSAQYINYVKLSDGKYISTDKTSTSGITKWADENNALYAALYSNNVNNYNSQMKIDVDKWYEEKILNTPAESLIDTEEIYCNDRSTSNDFGNWNLNANTTGLFTFNGLGYKTVRINGNDVDVYNLSCSNKMDAFSKDLTAKGNGDLSYPVGLVSYPEMFNLGNAEIRKNSSLYLLMSPKVIDMRYDLGYGVVSSNGNYSFYTDNNPSLRPSIALKSTALYSKGDGSMTNPYVVAE